MDYGVKDPLYHVPSMGISPISIKSNPNTLEVIDSASTVSIM